MPGAIFDIDGTLVDLFELHLRGFQHLIKEEFGLEFLREDLTEYYGRTGEEIVNAFFAKKGIEGAPYSNFASRRRQWIVDNLDGIDVLPGVHELLDGLEDTGFLLAVATSNTENIGSAILKESGLFERFKAASYKDETCKGKPAPDIFLKAVSLLGLESSQCVAFEDSVYGIDAAKAGGLKVIATATGTHSLDELRNHSPDILVKDLSEVSVDEIRNLIPSR